MANYGVFIWSSYGFVFLGLAWLGVSSLMQAKRVKQCLHRNKNV